MDWGAVGVWIAIAALFLESMVLLWGVFRYTTKIEKRLEKIESEYVPNHGTSMRDAINRIEKSMAKLEGRFEQHIEDLKSKI